MSVLISLLAQSGLADDSEIIFVEYNPCTGNKSKVKGSCNDRPGGYMKLREAFESLVEVPVGVAGPRVRVMTITKAICPATLLDASCSLT